MLLHAFVVQRCICNVARVDMKQPIRGRDSYSESQSTLARHLSSTHLSSPCSHTRPPHRMVLSTRSQPSPGPGPSSGWLGLSAHQARATKKNNGWSSSEPPSGVSSEVSIPGPRTGCNFAFLQHRPWASACRHGNMPPASAVNPDRSNKA